MRIHALIKSVANPHRRHWACKQLMQYLYVSCGLLVFRLPGGGGRGPTTTFGHTLWWAPPKSTTFLRRPLLQNLFKICTRVRVYRMFLTRTEGVYVLMVKK